MTKRNCPECGREVETEIKEERITKAERPRIKRVITREICSRCGHVFREKVTPL